MINSRQNYKKDHLCSEHCEWGCDLHLLSKKYQEQMTSFRGNLTNMTPMLFSSIRSPLILLVFVWRRLDINRIILDMFFKYTWNNFLHTQVEICIALILASPFENMENSTITDHDSTGDNLLLKHVSFLRVFFLPLLVIAFCRLRVK